MRLVLPLAAAPLVAATLASCAADPEPAADSGDDAPADSAEPEDAGPLEPVFSFAVLADPHVTGETENAERLRTAVTWLNENAAGRDIELVLIVGDIAWGDGMPVARGAFDALTIPWVPVIGDNEVELGAEQAYHETFADRYAALAGQLEGWRKADTPVANPQWDTTSWFQNAAFTWKGVRFVAIDWCSRIGDGSIQGEMADLHDFDGGTWRFFQEEMALLGDGPKERVNFFSHHPMHLSPGAFDVAEMDTLDAALWAQGDAVAADYAGHYHADGDEAEPGRPIEVHVTDATWDDAVTVRVVEVSANAATFAYAQELIEVPFGED